MSTNEQSTAKSILNTMTKLREQLAQFVKETENKIAGLEIAYEAITGNPVPKDAALPTPKAKTAKATPAPVRRTGGRRGMRIDRQATEKTLAFMQERGDKPTTISMVATKFNITKEAAAQRFRKLQQLGWATRVNPGKFVPVNPGKAATGFKVGGIITEHGIAPGTRKAEAAAE